VSSKFYSPDQHRAEKVRELFATIARRYDLLNGLMSLGLNRRWKQRLAQLAERELRTESGKPKEVLDLCCGTGDVALAFARCRPQTHVVGVDFTAEMLRVAAVRCSRLEHFGATSRIQLLQADALRLPFPGNAFDVVSVGYGLRNLADLDPARSGIEAGLREILRVLRPGGKLLSLDFGKPDSRLWRIVYFGYLRIVPPALSRLFCGDADTHAYIVPSLQNCPSQRELKTQMEQCGYADCGFEEFCGGAMAINFGRKPPSQ
jgi:demethylmenaquinone methyltransferase / 2-methoxy-6-polyprenyl-1,4-benzoquinol methylase